MEMRLEVVAVPVSDVDRAKRFYEEGCGFRVDLDDSPVPGIRFVQLTPPGSSCSIQVGAGLIDSPPGTAQGLQLIVTDIDAVRAALLERGVPVGPIQHFLDGEWREGKGGPWNAFARFNDPDGNGWLLQETPDR
jgi:catechol 2,3-dioxygenase-like lactoylglutathione lyase family enzyme